ncbi:MAG: hypothetical protein QNJ27_02765 [Simkaniaceae bacterium]|nr:hypothetical protein [Simkaniaceae bacterium]
MNKEYDLPWRVFVNGKKIGVYALSAALIAGLFIAKFEAKKERAKRDYVAATAAFTKWEQALDQGGSSLAKLKKLVEKHPELQAHYDPSIAQSLLANISPQEATPFIERTLQRTKQPYYIDYARTSLKIGEKRYQEALEEALSLKDKMASDSSFWEKSKKNSALFAFNLLRIATLNQQLNHKESELEAWTEIKQYGGWDQQHSPTDSMGHEGFKQLLSHFSRQETTLLDYIKAREEELRNP